MLVQIVGSGAEQKYGYNQLPISGDTAYIDRVILMTK